MTDSRAENQPLRSLALSAVLFLAAAGAGVAPAADGDIWWHLAAGREMVSRGQLLFRDPFSVGAGGRPWADVHWLFQLVAYAIHSQLGLAGLVLIKCVVTGLGAWVLLGAVERRPGSWSRGLFVTLLSSALFVARALLLVRPVIVSLLMMALFFWVLERVQRTGRHRVLVLLPLLQIVWVNCQGMSAIGLALVGAYALGTALSTAFGQTTYWPFARERANDGDARHHLRALGLAFLGCSLASCITPFGIAGIALPAKLLRRLIPDGSNVFARSIAENVAPFSLEQWSGEFWHLKWALALLALAIWCGGRRLRPTHALLLGGLSTLALMSNRNVLLLYWLGTPIAAGYLAPVVRARLLRFAGRASGQWAFRLNLAALLGLLCLCGTAAAREPSLERPTPFRMPEASARALASLPGGSIFSADHQGGYLIWSLYPRFRPYIDTRLVLRTAAEYQAYLALADQPERFPALQAREHFSYVVLPVAYPDRYLRLIGALATSPDWKLAFTNGLEVVFARRDIPLSEVLEPSDPALTTRLLAQLDRDYASAPKLRNAAQLQLATLELALGEFGQAERVLSLSSQPEAEALRARCHFGAGQLADAEAITIQLLKRDANDVSSLNLMALIALGRANRNAAIGYLRRAVAVNPFDPETNQVLANLEENR
jgi:hypothetical protein